jgi:hypothetical protein
MSSRSLIPNQHEYLQNKKVVTIHSEDRDMIKYPSSANFEIELPQDYINVEGVKLLTWTFPSNYSVFTSIRMNINLVFKITTAYNPGEHGLYSPLQSAIFEALYSNAANNYLITVEEGFYNPTQMAMELQNKMNESVNKYVMEYIMTNYPSLQSVYKSYDRFVVVYNSVNQKLWFGNTTDEFIMINDDINVYGGQKKYTETCASGGVIPQYANWGLPSYLGFTRANASSRTSIIPPRFYYGDVVQSGDNGFWLIPDQSLTGSTVQYLVTPLKINLMGDSHFYIEIDGMNNLDETSPYSLSKFTMHTNETNGIVNSAFAKIAVCTTPISQWFDRSNDNFKWFNPPAERIRKLKIKIRYHNNQLVSFGHFDWSITLEFMMLTPQINRRYHAVMPEIQLG